MQLPHKPDVLSLFPHWRIVVFVILGLLGCLFLLERTQGQWHEMPAEAPAQAAAAAADGFFVKWNAFSRLGPGS